MADTPAPATPAAPAKALSDADLVSDILSNQSTEKVDEAVTQAEDEPTEGDAEETDEEVEVHDDEDSTEEDEAAAATVPAGPLKAALAQVLQAIKDGKIKPEELKLTNKDWTAFRQANAKEKQKLDQRAGELTQWQQNAQAQLNQAINQLAPLEVWYVAEQNFLRDGDPEHLVKVLTERTKLEWDTLQKLVLNKQKLSPEVRRLREERDQDRRKLAELEAKLTAPAPIDAEQVKARDMAYIQQNLATHEGAKIPNFFARVYNVLLKTANHLGATMTPEQAAARVVRNERKRLEASPFYKKPEEPAEATGKGKKKTLLRKDSKSEGANPDKVETNDDIVNDLLRSHKVAGKAVGR